MKNTNLISKDKYLINQNLHIALHEAQSRQTQNGDLRGYRPGIYIINFRIINRKNNILAYNYVHYNLELIESILLYLLSRNEYTNMRTEE